MKYNLLGGLLVLLFSFSAFAKYQGEMKNVSTAICTTEVCLKIEAQQVSTSGINLQYYVDANVKLFDQKSRALQKEWSKVDVVLQLDKLSVKIQSKTTETLLELSPLYIQDFTTQITAAK